MPSTVNGIGTHYFGKKNLSTRSGPCPHCHHTALFSSYDTRLWLVVFFVPIIPLGRKRIVDDCSRCRRHYVIDLAKWEAQKQLDISGAAQKYRDQPSPEAAIDMHECLLSYRQMDEAREFRAIMKSQYADHARVQEYLGLTLSRLGDDEGSDQHFARAYELRPDLPNARAAMARHRMKAGQLDEAREMLDFLEKPGAAQLYSMEALEELADAYALSGRTSEALGLYRQVLREVPSAGQHEGFRQKMARVEKTSGTATTALPKKKLRFFRWGSMTGRTRFALIAVAILASLVCSNEWIRRHRQLHIVNGYAQPVVVRVDDGPEQKVSPGGVAIVDIGEGTHHAKVSGPIVEEFEFITQAEYFDRWSRAPVWVVNPGGAAVIKRAAAVYSNASDQSVPEPTYEFDQRFMVFLDIDNPFTPFSRAISSKSGPQTHTGISVYNESCAEVYQSFLYRNQHDKARKFLEARLKTRPDDDEMVTALISTFQSEADLPRITGVLKTGLSRRPVLMQWHRAYQSLVRDEAREQAMQAEYDALLAKEPDNASLLYLRGRVAGTRTEALSFFARAQKIEPLHPFVLFAFAIDAICEGDLEKARPLLESAVRQQPRNEQFRTMWDNVSAATGQLPRLESTRRTAMARKLDNVEGVYQLCRFLAAYGRKEEALKELEKAMMLGSPSFRSYVRAEAGMVRHQIYALAGDFPRAEKELELARMRPMQVEGLRFVLAMGQLRPAVALQCPTAARYLANSGFHHLTFYLAWDLAGNREEAEASLQRAIEVLKHGDADERRSAALLQAATPPTRDALGEIITAPSSKALLAAALVRKFPTERAWLAPLAARLNIDHDFPYHVIRRATESNAP